MKYRKKPVIVEATQWFKMGDHPAVVKQSMNSQKQLIGWIDTSAGWITATAGDYIITGVKGEHYPVKADIFEMTYEPVEEQA